MAISLAKAQNFSQDKLWNGVVDELRQDALLDMMVFDNTASSFGNGTTLNYIYNKMDDYSGAAFRAINKDYTASEATTVQKTVSLKVLGGSYEIDRIILNYVKGIDEQEAFQMKQKIKAIKRAFSKSFISGNATTDATSFDGLDKLIDSSMILDSGANLSTAALITSDYTKLTDAFRDMQANFDGAPTAFFCSPEGFALIQKIADRATGFTVTKDDFGRETFRFNGTPFTPLGDVTGSNNAVIPTTSNKTAFYPVRIGLDAVHAISPEGNDAGIKVYPIDRNSSDAVRKGAVEMVTAIALKNSRTAGKILVQIASGS
jgi:hypothetical protein